MVHFFVSYVQEDRAWAEWIAWQLEAADHRVTVQAWDFPAGSNLVHEMQRVAATADCTVAVLSPEYLNSDFVASEWYSAFRRDPLGEGRRLLPVLVRHCDPRGLLGSIVCVDLVGLAEPDARASLLAGVRQDRGKPVIPPPFPLSTVSSGLAPIRFPGPTPNLDEKPSSVTASPSPSERPTVQSKHTPINPLGLVGTSIGRYYLEEFIGAGGTGLVYRAVRRDLGRQVAIKLFYPLGSADVRFRQILKRGFRAQAALNHPNIVSIFDVGEEGVEGRHCFYLVMDYVQGEPLLIWSRGQDRHEDRFGRRLKVAIQIADALRLAHETTYRDEHGFEIRGVLHGDVKPANVLVESGDRARLLDFLLIDIQRIVDPILVRPNILVDDDDDHATSQFFGTPGFMSPEQERQGVLSVSSDIYGLGVTLAHLFLPGTGRPLRRMRRMLQEGTNELPYIVIQMVSKSPSNRPRTMMEVVQSLRAIKDLQV